MPDSQAPRMAAASATARQPMENRDWYALIGVYGLALGLRLANLREIRANDPFFYQPAVDPLFYHHWAMRIAGGDWMGEGVFLQGPLYPYLLGVLYGVAGSDLQLPRLLQALLGSVSCALVWGVARELFGRRVALVAGILAAVYAMSIFYEGSLLIVNVLIPLVLLLLWSSLRAAERPDPARLLLVGILAGLAALARPNLLLYLPFAVVWVLWLTHGRAPALRRLLLVASLLAGFAVCVLPSALRNQAVTGEWIWVSASGGMNFFNGNNADANGVHNVPSIFDRSQADHPEEQNRIYREYAERAVGRDLTAGEVSDYWLARGLDWIAEHPVDWLRLELRKLLLFLNAFEVWNNRSYTLSSQFSWVLRMPLPGFGFVAPLALLGLALSARSWRRLLPAYALLAIHLATGLVFFVLSRYRMPVVPILILFAAYALCWLFDALMEKRARELLAATAACVAFVFLVHLDVVPRDDLSVAHYNLGNKYRKLGRHRDAAREYLASIDRDPSYIAAYNNLALSLEDAGQREPAILAWQKVLALGRARGLEDHVEVAERHLRALGAEAESP